LNEWLEFFLRPALFLSARLPRSKRRVFKRLQRPVGGNEEYVLLGHHLQDVVGNDIRMLDGIRAGFGGDARGFLSNGVCGDFDTSGVRFVDDGFQDRKSTRLNSSHRTISYAVFC